jgi:hypothetical protein
VLTFSFPRGAFVEAAQSQRAAMARAATAAAKEVGAVVKQAGRAQIAAAGFSRNWQNTLKVDVYPSGGRTSIDAAIFAHHDIPYAGVFERGATISGSPLLWLPLSSTPKRVGGRRLTAGNYRQLVGADLFVIKRPGRPPLLAANVTGTAGKTGKRVTPAQLRRGARTKRRGDAHAAFGGRPERFTVRALPLFIGVPRVRLRARFNLRDVFSRGPGLLNAAFSRNLRN